MAHQDATAGFQAMSATASGAKLIDGKAIAQEFRREVRIASDRLAARGLRRPGLAVILVGDDPASQVYVRNKRMACDECGIVSVSHDLPHSTTETELMSLIEQMNADESIDGILVQVPLPDHIDERHIIEAIDPAKDVDGFHPFNVGRLALRHPLMRPCTPYGVTRLLEKTGIPAKGITAWSSAPRTWWVGPWRWNCCCRAQRSRSATVSPRGSSSSSAWPTSWSSRSASPASCAGNGSNPARS
jgi:hypothetical protein